MEASMARPRSIAQYPLSGQMHANHKSQARLLGLVQDTVTYRLRDRHTTRAFIPPSPCPKKGENNIGQQPSELAVSQ